MRHILDLATPAVTALALLAALGGPALADDVGGGGLDNLGGQAPAGTPVGDWRLGVEIIGTSIFSLGGGLIGSSFSGSSVGADVQRRLGDRWWLAFGVNGSYDGGDSTSSSFSGSVGVRYTLTPGPVLVDLGARAFGYEESQTACYDTNDAEAEGSTCYDTGSGGAGATVDLAARVPLGEHVLLSFAVELLSGGWRWSEQGNTTEEGLFVAGGLRPRVGLHAQF